MFGRTGAVMEHLYHIGDKISFINLNINTSYMLRFMLSLYKIK